MLTPEEKEEMCRVISQDMSDDIDRMVVDQLSEFIISQVRARGIIIVEDEAQGVFV